MRTPKNWSRVSKIWDWVSPENLARVSNLWPNQQFSSTALTLLMHYYLYRILVQPSGVVFLSDGHQLFLFILNTRVALVYVLSRSRAPAIPNLNIPILLTLSKDWLINIEFVFCMSNLKFDYLRDRREIKAIIEF